MTQEPAGGSYRPEIAQRLMMQATANVQLLAVLEVLYAPAFEDAEYLMDAADETQALAVLVDAVGRMQALDADGQVRQRLCACVDRAGDMLRIVTDRARASAGLTGTPARMSIGLDRLLQACAQLRAAIDLHDRPFDAPGAADAAQA